MEGDQADSPLNTLQDVLLSWFHLSQALETLLPPTVAATGSGTLLFL